MARDALASSSHWVERPLTKWDKHFNPARRELQCANIQLLSKSLNQGETRPSVTLKGVAFVAEENPQRSLQIWLAWLFET